MHNVKFQLCIVIIIFLLMILSIGALVRTLVGGDILRPGSVAAKAVLVFEAAHIDLADVLLELLEMAELLVQDLGDVGSIVEGEIFLILLVKVVISFQVLF